MPLSIQDFGTQHGILRAMPLSIQDFGMQHGILRAMPLSIQDFGTQHGILRAMPPPCVPNDRVTAAFYKGKEPDSSSKGSFKCKSLTSDQSGI